MIGLRQILIFFILNLYLIGNIQLSLAKHFCGGELIDFSFSKLENCCGQDESEDSGCCRNEQIQLTNDEHKSPTSHFGIKFCKIISVNSIEDYWFEIKVRFSIELKEEVSGFLRFKPPTLPLFLHHCSWVI